MSLLLGGCAEDSPPDAPGPGDSERATTSAAPAPSGKGIVAGAIPVSGSIRAYVVLTPERGDEAAPPSTRPVMDQIQMTFVPNVLFARAGHPVEFRSSDAELHNVNVKRSRTFDPEFNVAIPPGETFEHTFKNPGFYDVNCDIHPTMSAQILVAATPHVAMAEADGTFAFYDVDPGAYTLTVYSGTQRADQPVKVVPGQNDVQISFDRAKG
jgi:plastocyanin